MLRHRWGRFLVRSPLYDLRNAVAVRLHHDIAVGVADFFEDAFGFQFGQRLIIQPLFEFLDRGGGPPQASYPPGMMSPSRSTFAFRL
jgi:hypothetical protein